MSDLGRTRGDQAYRWIVGGGLAAIGALALNIQSGITKTAEAVQALQVQVADIQAQLKYAASRNEAQDAAIDELRRRVWRLPERAVP